VQWRHARACFLPISAPQGHQTSEDAAEALHVLQSFADAIASSGDRPLSVAAVRHRPIHRPPIHKQSTAPPLSREAGIIRMGWRLAHMNDAVATADAFASDRLPYRQAQSEKALATLWSIHYINNWEVEILLTDGGLRVHVQSGSTTLIYVAVLSVEPEELIISEIDMFHGVTRPYDLLMSHNIIVKIVSLSLIDLPLK